MSDQKDDVTVSDSADGSWPVLCARAHMSPIGSLALCHSKKKEHNPVLKAEMAEIAERLEECADVLRRLPDRETGQLRMQALQWPGVIRRLWDDAPKGVKTHRPPPTAAAVSRMEECIGWMVALARQERNFARAVWLGCAEHRPIEQVRRILGVHRETARIWRDNGLERIVAMRSTARKIA